MRRLLIILSLLTLASCTTNDDDSQAVETVDETSTTTTTTIDPSLVPATAEFTLGSQVYLFDAVCTTNTNFEVVATGTSATEDGSAVTFFIQASDFEPYVAIEFVGTTGSSTFEPAVDQPLAIDVVDNRIELSEAVFVENLDLATGQGTQEQTGSLQVICGEP